MNLFMNKPPALVVTFNGANGLAPTAYPWTDPEDVRPSIEGVDQQFVVSGSLTWLISGSRIRNVNSANTRVGVDLGARARRLLLNVENDESTALATRVGIILRGSSDMSTYLFAAVNRTIAGTFQLGLYTEGDSALLLATITPDTTIATLQPLEVIDSGDRVTINFSGQTASVADTTYNDQTLVGVGVNGSASALQAADNLLAWI